MKIAYFSDSLFPSKAANSVHVAKMCNALASLGHDVTLFCSGTGVVPSDVFSAYGVRHPFEIVPLRPKTGKLAKIWFVMRVINSVRRSHFDLIYGRDLIVLSPVSFLGYPIIYETHLSPDSTARRFLEHVMMAKANFLGCVVISKVLKSIYLSKHAVLREEKVFVAPDAADDPGNATRKTESTQKVKVGYVGHLYKGRGIGLIIKCAEALPDMEFHIVGGEKEDVEYWSARVESANVIFHGYQRNADLYEYYEMFDVVVAPYQYAVEKAGGGDTSSWMSPLKIFEYMSYGKAIVCSDLPVLREVLADKRTALLVPPDRTEEWVKALKLLKDTGIREAVGGNARKEFLHRYTWNKRASSVLDVFFKDHCACPSMTVQD